MVRSASYTLLLQASPKDKVAAGGAAGEAICVTPVTGVVLKETVGSPPAVVGAGEPPAAVGREKVGSEMGVLVGSVVEVGAASAVCVN